MNDSLRQLLQYMNSLGQPDPQVAQQVQQAQRVPANTAPANAPGASVQNLREVPSGQDDTPAHSEEWDRGMPGGGAQADPVFGTGLDVASAVTGAAEIPGMLRGGAEFASALGQRAGAAKAAFNRPARAIEELAHYATRSTKTAPFGQKTPAGLEAVKQAILDEPGNSLMSRLADSARAGKNVIPRSRADLARTETLVQDIRASAKDPRVAKLTGKINAAEEEKALRELQRARPGEAVHGGQTPQQRNDEMAKMGAKWLSDHYKAMHEGSVPLTPTEVPDMLKKLAQTVERTRTKS